MLYVEIIIKTSEEVYISVTNSKTDKYQQLQRSSPKQIDELVWQTKLSTQRGNNINILRRFYESIDKRIKTRLVNIMLIEHK